MDCLLDQKKFSSIADAIFSEFGIGEKDIEDNGQTIVASPRVFKLAFISPLDIAIQSIKLVNQSERGEVKIQFYFEKLFLISLLFFMLGFYWSYLFGIICYLFSVCFFGFFALSSLYMYKDEIEGAIKDPCL